MAYGPVHHGASGEPLEAEGVGDSSCFVGADITHEDHIAGVEPTVTIHILEA